MLTQEDLKQITNIVTNVVSSAVNPVSERIGLLEEKLVSLEDKVYEVSAQNESLMRDMSMVKVRLSGIYQDLEKLTNIVRKQHKEMIKRDNKLYGFVEVEDDKVKIRVKKLEDYLQISS